MNRQGVLPTNFGVYSLTTLYEGVKLMFKKYSTGDLLTYFGITRDTLRYYEEKGLVKPAKNWENNYRGYSIFDIYQLMMIDSYKKRGMTIHQIQKQLKDSSTEDLVNQLQIKKDELEKMIVDAQCMLKRIEGTQGFVKELEHNLNVFSVKSLPRYKVQGEVSDFIAVEEYESVKDVISANHEDLFSQLLRYVSFDDRNVLSTKLLIVSESDDKNSVGEYLDYPKCLYTVVTQSFDNEVDLDKEMYQLSKAYAEAHHLKLKGEAFATIRLVICEKSTVKTYIEVFIPFE